MFKSNKALTSLEFGRFFYKASCNLYVLPFDVSRPTRGHRFKIMLEHCTNNYRKNFFLYSV